MFLKKITITNRNTHKRYHYYVRIMNSQKVTTTSLQNKSKQVIRLRKCSEPQEPVREIYDALGYQYKPYHLKKFVLPKTENHNIGSAMKL
ncbi:MAG: hypothetical protein V1781_05895 [Bacteroidota bacterium]